jgi:hypothetical protein
MAHAPRHLAEPPRRFGLSHLQLVFLVTLIALAVVTAAIALATRDTGSGGGGQAAPPATSAKAGATTARASTTTASTAPAARPIRPTPGNLLADGDFERDLAGWTPLGRARVQRVQGGASGRWAAAVTGAGGDGPPGLARAGVTTTRPGTTYEALVWVQAATGRQVLLVLRERSGGQVVSSDEAGYTLPDDGWQQVAVEHHTRVPGSSLALEVVALNLPPDGRLLVDAVDLQVE